MPNYFFIDASGQKQGPINDQQLQTLAANGVITSNTSLETDGGHRGTAGQIPGLKFGNAGYGNQLPNQAHSPQTSILSWLLDFAFRDLRLPLINLWACRITYAISCIAAVLFAIGMTLAGLASLGPHPGLLILVPLFGLGAALFIFLSRLLCEWYIIMFDWIIVTTKAARLYVEEKSR